VTYRLRGALIEYGSDFLGPLPNVVIFQFNPERLTRQIQIPPRPGGPAAREVHQAGVPPVETITLKAEFDAANLLNDDNVLAHTFGIGPQLAALEKMVQPSNILGGLIGAVVDAVGDALGLGGGGGSPPTQPIPREAFPRILFLWGLTRVLPVTITSMTITEMQYDFLLNPVQADVDIGLSVTPIDACTDDIVARGAFEYSQTAKEVQAVANLVNTSEQIADLVPL
jgi:hypothetical protein